MIGLSAAHLVGEGMGSPVPFFEKQKQKWQKSDLIWGQNTLILTVYGEKILI